MSGPSLVARIEGALPGRTAAFAILLFVALCWAGTIVAGRAATPRPGRGARAKRQTG